MLRCKVSLVATMVGGLCSFANAAEPQIMIAAGDWSEPVSDGENGTLRGRLVIGERTRDEHRRETPLYVELQDASDSVGRTMRLFCDLGRNDFRPEYDGGLRCELRDEEGHLVEPVGYPFSGAVPPSQWITLPSEGAIRLRASPFGVHRPGAMALTPHLGALWVIENDDPGEYSLSGTFAINPPEEDPDPGQGLESGTVWRGTLVLPAVRITSAMTTQASNSGTARNETLFDPLPDSAIELIETLKESPHDFHTVNGPRLNYVSESDLPALMELLDSEESCAAVVLSVSSILPTEKSTIGHEAAYLIEGFRNRYFPMELTSSRFEPDVEEIKWWYRIWSNLRERAGEETAAD